MSRRQPFPARSLLKLAGVLALTGVSRAVTGRPAGVPGRHDGLIDAADARGGGAIRDGEHSKLTDLVTYGIGYVLALAMTCAAFALVYWRWASGTTALAIVFGLALAQALVHFRCFLHVDLKRSARDDLQLILFSTLIVCLMVGGTLVVLFNLRMRMM